MSVQLRSLRPTLLLVGFGLLAYAGCSSTAATTTPVTHPTMVEVSPEDFLGDVPCSEGPGLKRYVATLFDMNYVAMGGAGGASDDAGAGAGGTPVEDFQLPSSAPTPCLAAVGFGLVVAGRHYRVEIDGYDTDDLAPRASGSREMVSPAPAKLEAVPLATPRWTAHCDETVAVGLTIVRADHCAAFQPLVLDATGSVRIALGALLGPLSCGDRPGQVDHFSVQLSTGEQLANIACTADAEAVFSALAPRTRVSASVAAFSADGTDAFAGTTCDASTLPDASVDAECTVLSQVGTLRVDLVKALGQLDLSCAATSISAIEIKAADQKPARVVVPPDCLQPFDLGVAPGDAVVTLTAMALTGTDKVLTCGAKVQPGQLALAECQPN